MNSFYEDNRLARLLAEEMINHREHIHLENGWHPLKALDNLINKIGTSLKERFQDPNVLPVYCFEYAPEC
jgi:hypothetical protein